MVGFLWAPARPGEMALISLLNVAIVLGAELAWGKALAPAVVWAVGVGGATRVADLYLCRWWRTNHQPEADEADLAA